MERSKTVLWYEDLECHRQPSLYYLSSEDDPAGPHLICDWNGSPTDLGELEIDLMSKLIEAKSDDLENETRMLQLDNLETIEDCEHEIQETIKPRSISSHTTLTENDGSQLNFLTVPPFVESLIKRIVKSQNLKYPTIPEAVENQKLALQKNTVLPQPVKGSTSNGTTTKSKPKLANDSRGLSPPKKPRTKPLKNSEIKSGSAVKGSKGTCKSASQETNLNRYTDLKQEPKHKPQYNRYQQKNLSNSIQRPVSSSCNLYGGNDDKVIVIDESD